MLANIKNKIIIFFLAFLTLLALILWKTGGDLYVWDMLTIRLAPDPFLTFATPSPTPSNSAPDTTSPARIPDTRTWSEVFQAPIVNPEIKWKTYRNETYGFEMQYPSDWTYDIRESYIDFSYPNMNARRLTLYIWKGSKEEYEKNNIFTSFISGKILKKEGMLINGVDCTLVNSDGKSVNLGSLYCARDNYVFVFNDTMIVHNRDVSAYMIKTFRFIK